VPESIQDRAGHLNLIVGPSGPSATGTVGVWAEVVVVLRSMKPHPFGIGNHLKRMSASIEVTRYLQGSPARCELHA